MLKKDALGRVKTGVTQREMVLDQFERSGLSGPKFAAVAGIKYSTLVSWVQKRRQARALAPSGGAKGPPALGWVEAELKPSVAPAAPKSALRVRLAGGVVLEIADEAQARLAAGLLRALHVAASGPAC